MWIEIALIVGVVTTTVKGTQTDVLQGNDALGFEVMEELFKDEDQGNVFISPFSIESCLSAAYVGVAGTTRSEMNAVLHYANSASEMVFDTYSNYSKALMSRYDGSVVSSKSNSTKPLVKVANRIWLDNEFEAQVKSSYVSAVGQDNFYMLDLQANGSLQLINNWIENQTDGKLQAIHTKKKKKRRGKRYIKKTSLKKKKKKG
ncbi:proteinase inhibitor I4 serpin [Reticulomyxa filosa]|uniref:Proteinase inhibitor I4 serpin n=1 Tax=Reticulomyxa filosa TaxID=46433 RepID=X6M3R8_RETFI|nr:proteinase inhibitor I4 serpin [Reticulomyxa filosa]|eukprot:ETO08266.1 proteinase inhibitor I4 serpin [Reticulomyxa filosa]